MKYYTFLVLTSFLFCACLENNGYDLSNDDPFRGDPSERNWNSQGSSYTFSTTNLASTEGSITDITTFDITLDDSAISEETDGQFADDPNYDADIFSDSTFTKTITIKYSEDEVSYPELEGVTITANGAHIVVTSTKKVNYILSGSSSNGSFKLYSENKSAVTLQNLTLTNPSGAAVNIQTKKKTFINCPSATSNTLIDGLTYEMTDGEDQKGTIFSEGELVFCGSGKLTIKALGKNAIASDQYIRIHAGSNLSISVASNASNGFKCDQLRMNGGIVNVQNDAAGGKGVKCNGKTYLAGGRMTLITSGDVSESTSDGVTNIIGSCGLKSDSLLTICGSLLLCKSTGTGGKGISTDIDCVITSGSVCCITSGNMYGTSSSGFGGWGGGSASKGSSACCKPKGIKVDGNLIVSGGSVKVRCCSSASSGSYGHEGIEAKGTITISGGNIASFSYDDAINSAKKMTITDGNVFAYSINNDGIDSNSTMLIEGGWIIAIGTQSPELGIDTVEGTVCTISGGSMMVFSSTAMNQTFSASNGTVGNQGSFSASGGSTIAITSGDKGMYFVAPRNLQGRLQYYMKGCSSAEVSTSGSWTGSGIIPYYNFVSTL